MRSAIGVGAVVGALGVVAGAFGAHALDLPDEQREWWSTAVGYQMVHALALLVCGLLAQRGSVQRVAVPSRSFSCGTVVFSGRLYAMALGAPRWLGAITPVGGTLLIVGWLTLAWSSRAAGERT